MLNRTNKGKDAGPLPGPKHGKPPGNNANGGEPTRKKMDILKQSVPKGSTVKMSRCDAGGEMSTRGTRGSGYGRGYNQVTQNRKGR